jgi:hypothetical protein
MAHLAGKHGLVLRLDVWSGAVVDSLHDPQGLNVTETSEVSEHDGHLYLGSYHLNYVARMKL